MKKTFSNIAAPEYIWANNVKEVKDLKIHHRHMAMDLLRIFIAAKVGLTLWGPPGAGKALDNNTPILTTKGWSTMGKLQPGTQIYGINGKPCEVTAVYPQPANRTCYKVLFDDGSEIVADKDHLWSTKSDKQGTQKIHTTHEIRQTLTHTNHYIPCTQPIEFNQQEESLIYPHTLSAALKNKEHVKTLFALGVTEGKCIPAPYLTASEEDRELLLFGLVSWNDKEETASYITDTHQLAKDVLDLSLGLGYKATLRSANNTHTVTFPLTNPAAANLYHRRIIAIEPVESRPVTCITVDSPDSLFLAGESLIATHNTSQVEAMSKLTDEEGKNYNVVTIQPSNTDSTAIHGVLYTADTENGTVTKRATPDIPKEIHRAFHEENRLTIVFLDEMTTCMISQQHALLGFLTSGKWGDLDISDCIAIVMAANPPGTVNTVRPLDLQVLNRGGHLEWYGEKDLFVEGWTTGFGNPDKIPTINAQSELIGMFNLAPKEVFLAHKNPSGKGRKWEPENLVPYDDLFLSERSADNYGKISEQIDKSMPASMCANLDVRMMYKKKAGEMLFGKEWANRLGTVLNELRKQAFGSEEVTLLFSEADVTRETTFEELKAKLQQPMYDRAEIKVSDKKAETILQEFISSLTREFTVQKYHAAWAFASVTPRESAYGMYFDSIIKIVKIAQEAMTDGRIQREEINQPWFAPAITSMIKEASST